jgi:hypothetical protein
VEKTSASCQDVIHGGYTDPRLIDDEGEIPRLDVGLKFAQDEQTGHGRANLPQNPFSGGKSVQGAMVPIPASRLIPFAASPAHLAPRLSRDGPFDLPDLLVLIEDHAEGKVFADPKLPEICDLSFRHAQEGDDLLLGKVLEEAPCQEILDHAGSLERVARFPGLRIERARPEVSWADHIPEDEVNRPQDDGQRHDEPGIFIENQVAKHLCSKQIELILPKKEAAGNAHDEYDEKGTFLRLLPRTVRQLELGEKEEKS